MRHVLGARQGEKTSENDAKIAESAQPRTLFLTFFSAQPIIAAWFLSNRLIPQGWSLVVVHKYVNVFDYLMCLSLHTYSHSLLLHTTIAVPLVYHTFPPIINLYQSKKMVTPSTCCGKSGQACVWYVFSIGFRILFDFNSEPAANIHK